MPQEGSPPPEPAPAHHTREALLGLAMGVVTSPEGRRGPGWVGRGFLRVHRPPDPCSGDQGPPAALSPGLTCGHALAYAAPPPPLRNPPRLASTDAAPPTCLPACHPPLPQASPCTEPVWPCAWTQGPRDEDREQGFAPGDGTAATLTPPEHSDLAEDHMRRADLGVGEVGRGHRARGADPRCSGCTRGLGLARLGAECRDSPMRPPQGGTHKEDASNRGPG